MFASRKYQNEVAKIISRDLNLKIPPHSKSVFREVCKVQRKRGANTYSSAVVYALVQMNTFYDLERDETKEFF